MAGNEIVLGEFVIPPPRRRVTAPARPRLQRRVDPNAPVDSIGAETPGTGNDSGRSEQDVPPPQSERDAARTDMAALARSAIPENAFEDVVAPELPPSEQVLGDAAGIQLDDEVAPDAPMVAPDTVPPAQPPEVRLAPATQLRVPMTGATPPAGAQLRAPMTGPHVTAPAVPALRAPMVAPDTLEDEVDSIGAAPAAPGAPSAPDAPPEYEDDGELVSEIGATLKGADRRDPELDARAQQAREDAADRTQAQRTQRAQRAIAILSAVPALFGGRSGGESGAALAQLSMGLDPNAPLERIRQRREARDASAREEEEREYTRGLEERRSELENRRIAQAESATAARNRRTSAEFDIDSTDAAALRQAYSATIGNLSDEAARLLPGFITREYGGGLDLSQQTASGMQSLIDQLNRELARQEELNPRAFRLGRHGGGRARAPRGSLAGLTSGGQTQRGHDYGGPIGARELTDAELREDAQRQGFGGSVAPARTPEDEAQITGDAPEVVRERRRANGQDPETGQPAGYRDPRRAQRPAAQPGRPRTEGRAADDAPVDISVQEPTPEQVRRLPIEQRSTVALLRAYQRAHPGATWEEAVAAAPLLQPTERSSLLARFGSDTVVQVPGWRQSLNLELQPQELRELRAQNAATERMASASQRMEELAEQISPTDLARNVFTTNAAMQDALNISREMQASMRALQNMGVPNGPEMAMALEQAGEIRTPRDLARVITTYRRLRRWALESNRDRMQSNGFVRRRGGR